jgi:hypothetical protein
MLTSAIIDGKEYIIADPGNYGMRGSVGRGRGTMMGGSTGRRCW